MVCFCLIRHPGLSTDSYENVPKWVIKAIDKIRRSFIEPTIIASVKLNTMFSSEPMQQLLIQPFTKNITECYFLKFVTIYYCKYHA